MKRKSRDVPGVGANTTWRGATTRKSSADLAVSAPTSKPTASTKSSQDEIVDLHRREPYQLDTSKYRLLAEGDTQGTQSY